MAKGRKTGGRLRGTPNKMSSLMKQRIARVLDAIDVEGELENLHGNEKVKLWLSLVEYIVPKLERVSPIQAEIEALKSELQTLKQLTDEIANQNGHRDAEIRPKNRAQAVEKPKGTVGDGIPEIRA